MNYENVKKRSSVFLQINFIYIYIIKDSYINICNLINLFYVYIFYK